MVSEGRVGVGIVRTDQSGQVSIKRIVGGGGCRQRAEVRIRVDDAGEGQVNG